MINRWERVHGLTHKAINLGVIAKGVRHTGKARLLIFKRGKAGMSALIKNQVTVAGGLRIRNIGKPFQLSCVVSEVVAYEEEKHEVRLELQSIFAHGKVFARCPGSAYAKIDDFRTGSGFLEIALDHRSDRILKWNL